MRSVKALIRVIALNTTLRRRAVAVVYVISITQAGQAGPIFLFKNTVKTWTNNQKYMKE